MSTVKQLTDTVAALQTHYEHESRLRQEAESRLNSTIVEETRCINEDAENWRKQAERNNELFLKAHESTQRSAEQIQQLFMKAQERIDEKDKMLVECHHMLIQRFGATNAV